jgi:hypothetical protein
VGVSVDFAPASISFGIWPPGSTTPPLSAQCGVLSAPVSVIASIPEADDDSEGAFSVSVASFVMREYSEFADGDLPPGAKPVVVREEIAALQQQVGAGTSLSVLGGQYVVVSVVFAPTADTPVNCSAMLQIQGDTWDPVPPIPITAYVGEIEVAVPPITVTQGGGTASGRVTVTVTGVYTENGAIAASIGFDPTETPEGFVTLGESLLPLGPGTSPPWQASCDLTATAGGLASGEYFFGLIVSVSGNNATATITMNVVAPAVPYYAIKSDLGTVIDVEGPVIVSGSPAGTESQLWAFVPDPAGSGYYFIVNKQPPGNVIDIEGASTAPGMLLVPAPQQPTDYDSQLWYFVSNPWGQGYFIVSALNGNVIDIRGGSPKPGVPLDSYLLKLQGYQNQIWTVVDGNFPAPAQSVPSPSRGLVGDMNYYLDGGGEALTGVSVTVTLTSDFVSTANGYSFQLNCYPTTGPNDEWQQFFFAYNPSNNQLMAEINTWNPPGIYENPRVPTLAFEAPLPVNLPTPAIPANYVLTIALTYYQDPQYEGTDQYTAAVAGAIFTVSQQTAEGGQILLGTTTLTMIGQTLYTTGQPATVANLAPISALTFNIGGYGSGTPAALAGGAGTITYAASVGLNATTYDPTQLELSTASTAETGENSNVVFGPLPWPWSPSTVLPSQLVEQLFQAAPGQTPIAGSVPP